MNRENELLPKRRHLSRLENIFDIFQGEIYLITICVKDRKRILNTFALCKILAKAFEDALSIHGWMVGRYVIMPDHVHFFASPATERAKDLSRFVGGWKHWTHKQITERISPQFKWQKEFFDHLLRSDESYSEKWEYVRNNPIRAGLAEKSEEWPYQGEIHLLRR